MHPDMRRRKKVLAIKIIAVAFILLLIFRIDWYNLVSHGSFPQSGVQERKVLSLWLPINFTTYIRI